VVRSCSLEAVLDVGRRSAYGAAHGGGWTGWALEWIPDRRKLALDNWKNDEGQIKHHVLPVIGHMVEADERSKVEAARVEIYRDANKTERLLHIQELGAPGDPIVSAMIWCPRAERGQSATAIIGVALFGALSTEPWRYRRRRDRGILPSWPRPLPPRLSPKRLP
jgi:hypothetical protein